MWEPRQRSTSKVEGVISDSVFGLTGTRDIPKTVIYRHSSTSRSISSIGPQTWTTDVPSPSHGLMSRIGILVNLKLVSA